MAKTVFPSLQARLSTMGKQVKVLWCVHFILRRPCLGSHVESSEFPSSLPSFHLWELGMVPAQDPLGRKLMGQNCWRGASWSCHSPLGVFTMCHHWALLTLSGVILSHKPYEKVGSVPCDSGNFNNVFHRRIVSKWQNWDRTGTGWFQGSALLRTQQLEEPRSAVWKTSPGFPSALLLPAVSAYVCQRALRVVFLLFISLFKSILLIFVNQSLGTISDVFGQLYTNNVFPSN